MKQLILKRDVDLEKTKTQAGMTALCIASSEGYDTHFVLFCVHPLHSMCYCHPVYMHFQVMLFKKQTARVGCLSFSVVACKIRSRVAHYLRSASGGFSPCFLGWSCLSGGGRVDM